jgi:UPF0042 nucleotide-binding protein
MDLVLVTGMSGAGKATVAKTFEEHSYVVIDNLPPSLLPSLVEEYQGSGVTEKLCVVTDGRCGKLIHGLGPAIDSLKKAEVAVKLLFLDASDAVLVQRYSETRRHHPAVTDAHGVLAGIELERSLLYQVRSLADDLIDTSDWKVGQLRQRIHDRLFSPDVPAPGLAVSLTSFGFKYGLPIDADLVFDVRFLANPHYEDQLRPFDGRNKIIDEYVMKDPASGPYLEKLLDLLRFSLPRFIEEGKAYLTVAIGCTGGRHRSVVIAERLGAELQQLGYRVVFNHRDVSK